jgi:hypothetical protein
VNPFGCFELLWKAEGANTKKIPVPIDIRAATKNNEKRLLLSDWRVFAEMLACVRVYPEPTVRTTTSRGLGTCSTVFRLAKTIAWPFEKVPP